MSDAAEFSAPEPTTGEVAVLRLKPGEDRRLRAGHLWVFSNEVDNQATPLGGFAVGAIARVHSDRDQFLGYAYVNPHALICARILSRSHVHPPDRSLLAHRLRMALALRERLTAAPYYRVVFGEADGLPGLVLDRYGALVVGQIATAGMEALRADVEPAVLLARVHQGGHQPGNQFGEGQESRLVVVDADFGFEADELLERSDDGCGEMLKRIEQQGFADDPALFLGVAIPAAEFIEGGVAP